MSDGRSLLSKLPPPPDGKTGWPWTEQSIAPAEAQENSDSWPKISIVTPSYNQGQFIEKTIRSVLLQRYPNLEYVVIDGGSSDETIQILKKYDPWIDDWVSEPDDGQSAAINEGFRRSTGEFGSWINSDDWLCQGALVNHASCVGFSRSRFYAGICYAYRDGEKSQKISTEIGSLEDLVRLSEYWGASYLGNSDSPRYIAQPETLFPLDKFREVGGLNEDNHLSMDYELWGDLFLNGVKIEKTEIEYGVIRRHDAQKTADRLGAVGSLVNTAHRLIEENEEWDEEEKEKMKKKVQEYYQEEKRVESKKFRKSGRLARIGLPRRIVRVMRYMKDALTG